jgi:hypothetical protein
MVVRITSEYHTMSLGLGAQVVNIGYGRNCSHNHVEVGTDKRYHHCLIEMAHWGSSLDKIH